MIPNIKLQSRSRLNDKAVSIYVYIFLDFTWLKGAIKSLESYHIKYNYYLITSDDEFKMIKDKRFY